MVLFSTAYTHLSPLVHSHTQYVQKKDAEYKNNLEDTVWSMDKFNDYINTYVAPHRGLPQDWVYTVFSVSYLTKRARLLNEHIK